ncbi:type II toxin-antitoxin system RelE/ParE family toxin [Planococcus sp. ISL-110]|uniref:type II toxin-antitoxin system RelE/ParE family toxin n=1 Tax=Planococcus sp. ISL-110 TaxID=2819167 RepID=UPI001BE4ECBA|nr:type II toxin-antitoxin system RelE/ParE family toxin [Planococcus sp. ISL-110]MBT2571147.1 type II toxin-antitoxin system RelE/ParE family toxin [Planococcus sp. ISL-110]
MNEGLLPYQLSKRAGKELKKIKKSDQVLYLKMDEAITSIRKDPTIGEAKKGDLKGYSCLDIHHRGTNYELCYAIRENEEGELVLVVLLGPRENFYLELKRYLGN